MKSPLVALALASFAAPLSAHNDGYYLEFGLGVTDTETLASPFGAIKFDAGYSGSLLVGHQWTQILDTRLNFGLECEAYFNEQAFPNTQLDPSSSTLEQFSHGGFVAGGVLTWPYSDDIAFYGGAGVGLATALDLDSKSDAASTYGIKEDSAMIYQGKAGMRFAMGEQLYWFAQYKYIALEPIQFRDNLIGPSSELEIELAQNVIEVGVRWGS
jgi:hypothetical protein